jgi:hypothetical protein
VSLIVPGGRPAPVPSGPVPVDYAFTVAVESWGDAVIIDADSEVDVVREAQPDDIYGAIAVVVNDGPSIILDPRGKYEYAFKVLKLSAGKVLLAPDLGLKVSPVRSPDENHIVAALSTLGANIVAMKTTDMLIATLQGQAVAAQNAALAKAAGVG